MNRAKKLNLDKDLVPLDTYTHPVSGARLIRAAYDNKGETGYVVAWAAPWQKTIGDYQYRKTEAGSENLFRRMKKQGPPDTPALRRDWQRAMVYGWQEDHIEPDTTILNEAEMREVVKSVAADFNIKAPTFKYEEPRDPENVESWYYKRHHILMRHQQLCFLLHEMAHAIDEKLNKNAWSDHGPSFVRTMIEVAVRFHGADREKLESTAAKEGIMVADRGALRRLPRPEA